MTLSDTDEDADKMCSFIVQLMQKDRRKIKHKGEKLIYIGFLVYRVKKHNIFYTNLWVLLDTSKQDDEK